MRLEISLLTFVQLYDWKTRQWSSMLGLCNVKPHMGTCTCPAALVHSVLGMLEPGHLSGSSDGGRQLMLEVQLPFLATPKCEGLKGLFLVICWKTGNFGW